MVVYYRHMNRKPLPACYVRGFYLIPVPHSPYAQFADNSSKVQGFCTIVLSRGQSSVSKPTGKPPLGDRQQSKYYVLLAGYLGVTSAYVQV